jgi:hypothetical protein
MCTRPDDVDHEFYGGEQQLVLAVILLLIRTARL